MTPPPPWKIPHFFFSFAGWKSPNNISNNYSKISLGHKIQLRDSQDISFILFVSIIAMSRGTCQDWHVESDIWRAICLERRIKIDMLRKTCWEWHVKSDMLRVTCWEILNVTLDMSRVTCWEWHVKSDMSESDMSRVTCREWHGESDMARLTCLEWHVESWHV